MTTWSTCSPMGDTCCRFATATSSSTPPKFTARCFRKGSARPPFAILGEIRQCFSQFVKQFPLVVLAICKGIFCSVIFFGGGGECCRTVYDGSPQIYHSHPEKKKLNHLSGTAANAINKTATLKSNVSKNYSSSATLFIVDVFAFPVYIIIITSSSSSSSITRSSHITSSLFAWSHYYYYTNWHSLRKRWLQKRKEILNEHKDECGE